METQSDNIMRATPRIKDNSIHHECEIEGPWQEAFLKSPQTGDLAKTFGVRFPQIDTYPVDLTDLPRSIAVIPLLCNVMPIAWCYGATVYVEEVDEDFHEAQLTLKRAYQAYYPELELNGSLVAHRLVRNTIVAPQSPPLVLFSGGVDATFSLWGNIALRPSLVTIRGSDVYFTTEDDKAWHVIKARHKDVAQQVEAKFYTIESSFKTWLCYWKLNKFAKLAKGANWWFNMQQGPALVGLCAPLAWMLKSKRVIISSSFSSKDQLYMKCGSNPLFDESLHYFGTSVQHFDFSVSRQEKVGFLCQQAVMRQTNIPLRVCWQTRTGNNCCKCEKCLRTIFAIYAEGGNPSEFGFHASQEEIIANVENPAFVMGVFWIDVLIRLNTSKLRDLPQVQAALSKGVSTDALKRFLGILAV